MAGVQLDSIEIDTHGEGAAEIKHSPEVVAAITAATEGVYQRAKGMSVSGDAEYWHGVDTLPTTTKGYVLTANLAAMHANSRAGVHPLEAAIGG